MTFNISKNLWQLYSENKTACCVNKNRLTHVLAKALCILTLVLLSACDKGPQKRESSTTYVPAENMAVIAYFHGNNIETLQDYPLDKLTHIIYSFLHLQGNKLAFDNSASRNMVENMVRLKEKYPKLKVMIAFGGWGGCQTCSDVFSTEQGRTEFVASAKQILDEYQLDGLDLDWEYPVVEGPPGHKFTAEDKSNFTALVQALRVSLGAENLLTFAAGGFQDFMERAIDWQAVMPQVEWVNLMSYDLVNGFSTTTGHHTPLYSTHEQKDSTDSAVRFLISKGIPAEKIVIGAAFYARIFENVSAENKGLYQSDSKFQTSINYHEFKDYFKANPGFSYYWDNVAKASYAYNPEKQLFATYDDEQSLWVKTQYVKEKGLRGIMFWQLKGDLPNNGLLNAIYRTKMGNKDK